MLNILIRIIRRLINLFFWLLYKNTFESLSIRTFFALPFRVDGREGISIGERTSFQRGVWLYCSGLNGLKARLSIGRECVFGYNNHITSVGSVSIGSFVLTANNVYISDNIHGYEDVTKPIINQPLKFKKPVVIGDGAWIGENVCIIGATVGKNSVVGANSVVINDIPDYSVAVGAPAKVIKRYDFNLSKWIDV